jgi:DNA-binding SARP family transcriptional activator
MAHADYSIFGDDAPHSRGCGNAALSTTMASVRMGASGHHKGRGRMIEIKLFGQTSAVVNGQEVPASSLSAKQRRILEILALNAGSPVTKERLADLLWEGSPPASYVGTLDSYVCVLRRTLGLGAGRSSLLATTPVGYVLAIGDEVSVDLWQFQALAAEAADACGEQAVATTQAALQLVRGELLADVLYADWAVRAREVSDRMLVEVCLKGAQRANALGKSATAERFARLAVEKDVVCEDAWRQLMLAHWFSGRRGRALAAYGELRAAMAEQVGDEPSSETYQLYLTILRDASEADARHLDDERAELTTLLRLLRQALDCMPGVRAPARDAALSEVAMRALAGAA